MFSVMFDTEKKDMKKTTRKKGKSRKTKIKTAQIGRSLKIIGAANSSVFCTSFLLVASCIYILQPVRFYIFFLYVSVPRDELKFYGWFKFISSFEYILKSFRDAGL